MLLGTVFGAFGMNVKEPLCNDELSVVCRLALLLLLSSSVDIHTRTPFLLLSARTAMWSMPVVWTETENENDSANRDHSECF